MKNIAKYMLLVIALVGMLSLTSCNPENGPVGTDTNPLYQSTSLTSDLYSMTDIDVYSPEATAINEDLGIVGKPPADKNLLGPLGFVLSRLNLTPVQVEGVKTATAAYIKCVTDATATIRAAEKAIMDQLKTDVTAITDQVKAGTMDRKTAREQITALQKAARTALEAIPGRAEAAQAVKDCYLKYLSDIKALLTPEQIATLEKILTGKGGGNTGGGKGGVKIEGPLGPVLGGLGLNDVQIKAVNDCAKKYNECYLAAMKPIKDQEAALIDGLNKTRAKIMADIKAGVLTREEGTKQIQTAEIATKTAIANIPGRTEAEAAAKLCYATYLECVKGTLTPDQLLKFNKLIGNSGGTGPTKP
jgi:hypothetical protein